MKKCIRVLSVLLCIMLCLCACGKTEPPAPELSYEELLDTVKQENTVLLSDVLVDTEPGGITVADERIWFWGSGIAGRVLVSCAPDGSDVRQTALPKTEPAAASLALCDKVASAIEWAFADAQGGVHILQRDRLYNSAEDELYYFRSLLPDGALSEPVLLPVAGDVSIKNLYLEENGGLWMTAVEYAFSSNGALEGFAASLLCVSVKDGNILYAASLPENHMPENEGLVRLPDGRMLLFAQEAGVVADGTNQRIFLVEEPFARQLVLKALEVSPAIDGYVFYPLLENDNTAQQLRIFTGDRVYGWDPDTGLAQELFRLTNYGVDISAVQQVFVLPEEKLLAVTKSRDGDYVFHSLSYVEGDLLDGREVITVGLLGTNTGELVEKAIRNYNFSGPEVLVKAVSYSDTAARAAGFASGEDMLYTAVVNGEAPDIILLPNLFRPQLIRSGLFLDLYPYIDADDELSREQFLPNVLTAEEYDGTLPVIMPAYLLFTAVGDPDVVGEKPGWSWEEYEAVLAANPQVVTPYYRVDRLMQLYHQVILGGRFIDRRAGQSHLDSPEFVRLLEASAGYAEQAADPMFDPKPIYTARQALLRWTLLGDFRTALLLQYEFDGSFVCKGYPSDTGGSALMPALRLGITSHCNDPDAAWQFVRYMLLPEFQDALLGTAFPLREDSLTAAVMKAGEEVPGAGAASYLSGLTEEQMDYWRRGLTPQECEGILDAIRAAHQVVQPDPVIEAILAEEASAYYAGVRSAQETAALIDSRVQLYLDEQG